MEVIDNGMVERTLEEERLMSCLSSFSWNDFLIQSGFPLKEFLKLFRASNEDIVVRCRRVVTRSTGF